MTTRRERAIIMKLEIQQADSDTALADLIERHLREACEEAAREERQRICDALTGRNTLRKKCVSCGEYHPSHAQHSCAQNEGRNRPTPEDALWAVAELVRLVDAADFLVKCGFRMDVKNLVNDMADLLAGLRDTPAAKAIVGGGK